MPNAGVVFQPKHGSHILCQTRRSCFNSNADVAPQQTRREGRILCQTRWSYCSSIRRPQGSVSISTRPRLIARSASNNETRVSDITDNSYWVNQYPLSLHIMGHKSPLWSGQYPLFSHIMGHKFPFWRDLRGE